MADRFCLHCGRRIRRSVKLEGGTWVHDHSSRVVCDQGFEGRVTFAVPEVLEEVQ